MRIREHYGRRDFGYMDLEVTLEDPKYYTRPFTLKTELNLIPDSDVLEFVCNENEKDRVHLEKRYRYYFRKLNAGQTCSTANSWPRSRRPQ